MPGPKLILNRDSNLFVPARGSGMNLPRPALTKNSDQFSDRGTDRRDDTLSKIAEDLQLGRSEEALKKLREKIELAKVQKDANGKLYEALYGLLNGQDESALKEIRNLAAKDPFAKEYLDIYEGQLLAYHELQKLQVFETYLQLCGVDAENVSLKSLEAEFAKTSDFSSAFAGIAPQDQILLSKVSGGENFLKLFLNTENPAISLSKLIKELNRRGETNKALALSALLLGGRMTFDLSANDRRRIEYEVAEMTGQSLNSRDQILHTIKNFLAKAFDPEMIFTFTMAGLAYRLQRGRLIFKYANQGERFVFGTRIALNRGVLALNRARLGAFTAELGVFTGLGLLGQVARGYQVGPHEIKQALAQNTLILLTLKLGNHVGAVAYAKGVGKYNPASLALRGSDRVHQIFYGNAVGTFSLALGHKLEAKAGYRQDHASFGTFLGEALETQLQLALGGRIAHLSLGRSYHQFIQRYEDKARIYERFHLNNLFPPKEGLKYSFFPPLTFESLGKKPFLNSLNLRVVDGLIDGDEGSYVSGVDFKHERGSPDQPMHIRALEIDDLVHRAFSPQLKKELMSVTGLGTPWELAKMEAGYLGDYLAEIYKRHSANLEKAQKSLGNVPKEKLKPEQNDLMTSLEIISEIIGVLEYSRRSQQVDVAQGFHNSIRGGVSVETYEAHKVFLANYYRINLTADPESIGPEDTVPLEKGILSIGSGAMGGGLLAALRSKIMPGNGNFGLLSWWHMFFVTARSGSDVRAINVDGMKERNKGGHLINAHHEPSILAIQDSSPATRLLRRVMQLQLLNIPSSAVASVVTPDYIRELPQGAILASPIKGVVGLTRDSESGELRPLSRKELDDPNVEVVSTYRPDLYMKQVIIQVNIENARNLMNANSETYLMDDFIAALDTPFVKDLSAQGKSPLEIFFSFKKRTRRRILDQFKEAGDEYQSLADRLEKYHALDHVEVVAIQGYFPHGMLFMGQRVNLVFYGEGDLSAAKKVAALYDGPSVTATVSNRIASGVWGGVYKNIGTLALGYEVGKMAYENASKEGNGELTQDISDKVGRILQRLIADMEKMIIDNEGVRAAKPGSVFDAEVVEDIQRCGGIDVPILMGFVRRARALDAENLSNEDAKEFLLEVLNSKVATTRNPKRGIMQAIIQDWNSRRKAPFAVLEILPDKMKTIEGEISLPVMVARAHSRENVEQRRLPDFVYELYRDLFPKRFDAMGDLPPRIGPFLIKALHQSVASETFQVNRSDLRKAINLATDSEIATLNDEFAKLGNLHAARHYEDAVVDPAYIRQMEIVNSLSKLLSQGYHLRGPRIDMQLEDSAFSNAYSIPIQYHSKGGVTQKGTYTLLRMNKEAAQDNIHKLGHLFKHYSDRSDFIVKMDVVIDAPLSKQEARRIYRQIQDIVQDYKTINHNKYFIDFYYRKFDESKSHREFGTMVISVPYGPSELRTAGMTPKFIRIVQSKFGLNASELRTNVDRLTALSRDLNANSNWVRLLTQMSHLPIYTGLQASFARPEVNVLLATIDQKSGGIDRVYALHEFEGEAFVSNPEFFSVAELPQKSIGQETENPSNRGISLAEFLENERKLGLEVKVLPVKWAPLESALLDLLPGVDGAQLLVFLKNNKEQALELHSALSELYFKEQSEVESEAARIILEYMNGESK